MAPKSLAGRKSASTRLHDLIPSLVGEIARTWTREASLRNSRWWNMRIRAKNQSMSAHQERRSLGKDVGIGKTCSIFQHKVGRHSRLLRHTTYILDVGAAANVPCRQRLDQKWRNAHMQPKTERAMMPTKVSLTPRLSFIVCFS